MFRYIQYALSLCLLCFSLLALPVAAQDALIGPETYPPDVNPLTGRTVADPDVLDQRPLIIKISNAPAEVRPQFGLMRADIVWEYVIEGGYTRFAAIYYTHEVEQVGPVRSVRLADLSLVPIYDALLAHSGGSEGMLDQFRSSAFLTSRNLPGGPCPPMCRIERPGVAVEHTLMTDTQALRDFAAANNRDVGEPEISGMAFSQTTPENGVGLDGLTITYRNAELDWTWDADLDAWLRRHGGEPHLDALTEEQISAANVLVIETDHIDQPSPYDGYWGYANYATNPEITGTGRVILLRDGQYFEGEWQRSDDTAPLTFVDADGEPLPFKPGNTFVNLVPRWANGYELTFMLSDAPTTGITVNSAILRAGPGQAYGEIGFARGDETLPMIGRNQSGDWVQVINSEDLPMWVSSVVLDAESETILALPLNRSTFE